MSFLVKEGLFIKGFLGRKQSERLGDACAPRGWKAHPRVTVHCIGKPLSNFADIFRHCIADSQVSVRHIRDVHYRVTP